MHQLQAYLMLNTNNLLHVNAISTFNRNNSNARASVQQVTEAEWLTRPRDSRCAEESKTEPPSFVPRNLETRLYTPLPEWLLPSKVKKVHTGITAGVSWMYLVRKLAWFTGYSEVFVVTPNISKLWLWKYLQALQNSHFSNLYLLITHKYLPPFLSTNYNVEGLELKYRR